MNTYTLHILFGQRICSYPGQYAPEALETMDEFAFDENGQWLRDKCEEYRKTGEFTALQIVCVNVPFAGIEKALTSPTIEGSIS